MKERGEGRGEGREIQTTTEFSPKVKSVTPNDPANRKEAKGIQGTHFTRNRMKQFLPVLIDREALGNRDKCLRNATFYIFQNMQRFRRSRIEILQKYLHFSRFGICRSAVLIFRVHQRALVRAFVFFIYIQQNLFPGLLWLS